MAKTRVDDDGMLPEYDFSNGVRGKYAARYASMGVRVTIDADVAEFFPDSIAVNEALRTLARIEKVRKQSGSAVRTKKPRQIRATAKVTAPARPTRKKAG